MEEILKDVGGSERLREELGRFEVLRGILEGVEGTQRDVGWKGKP